MMRARSSYLPLTGIAFVALVILAFAVSGETPALDAGPDALVAEWADNGAQQIAGVGIGALATILLLIFASDLSARLRARTERAAIAGSLVFAGALLMTVGIAIDGTMVVALVETADDISPESVQTLHALYEHDWVPVALGLATLLGASGVGIVRSRLLPAWMGWVAIVLAVLLPTPAAVATFIGGGIWVIAVSVMLARDRTAAPAAASAA